MQKRMIGQTNLEVSVIGLGTVKFGRNQGLKYPQAFNLPQDKELEQLLDKASELGVNLLDTAPAYGSSEERLGKLLSGNKRHAWIISTKAGEYFNDSVSSFNFSPECIRTSVEKSLKKLRTDYLDVVLAHSNGDDVAIIHQDEVFQTLSSLKAEGKIRAFGMSTKTIAGGVLTAESADVVMTTFNPAETSEREVIRAAHANHCAVFIKKALASGHLQRLGEHPVAAAMNFIFQEPGVTSVIVGTLNPKHLTESVEAALAAVPLASTNR